MKALEKASEAGTLHADDRSAQYDKATNAQLLTAVNEAWTKIRKCEKSLGEKDAAIEELKRKARNYRIVNIALTSILTGLAWEGVKFLLSIFLK
jgi:hypothetical protein